MKDMDPWIHGSPAGAAARAASGAAAGAGASAAAAVWNLPCTNRGARCTPLMKTNITK